jgi:hypothetical protein
MNNKECQAETEVQQSDAAEVTKSAHTCCNTNVVGGSFPLDPFLEVIRKRFPKYISVQETKCNALRKKHSALFRKQHYNDYCFIEYNEGCSFFSISIFKSDWKDFEKVENDFLDFSFSFAVTLKDVETIMNCIV